MVFCSKCGAQSPDEMAFCPRCGTRLSVQPPAPPTNYTPVQGSYSTRPPSRNRLPLIVAAIVVCVIIAAAVLIS